MREKRGRKREVSPRRTAPVTVSKVEQRNRVRSECELILLVTTDPAAMLGRVLAVLGRVLHVRETRYSVQVRPVRRWELGVRSELEVWVGRRLVVYGRQGSDEAVGESWWFHTPDADLAAALEGLRD